MIKISRICVLMLFLFAKINSIAQTSTPGGGMTDIDGNVYPTIILGTQEWCKENLKTTKFRNGDLIPYISSNATWANTTTPAKCIYNNDSLLNYNVFGYLYNFYAVEDPRNLCPTGWHVPSDYEWTVLTNYLGGLPIAGGKMKSLNIWNAPNTGATNITGFTALPGGLRDYPGNFSSIYATGNWWSSTPRQMVGYFDGYYRDIWFNSAQIERMSYSKKDGFSVRCIKDSICSIDTSVYFNIPQNINACGDSTLINAGSGYTSYTWNTGATTASIYAKATGWYKVTVSNGTCTASDSVFVSLLKAKITASKLRICKGEIITLQADTNISANVACAKTDLPSNLQTGLVAYYPFCGNANDVSGNGNHGTVNGATLDNDRLGNNSGSYYFDSNDYIEVATNNANAQDLTNNFTISSWFKIETTSVFNTILSKAVCGQANVNGYIFGLQDFPTLGLNSKVHFQASPIMSDATPVLPDSNGIVRKNACDWQNFTVTYNKQTQILKYYLNGKLVFTKNILFTILNNATIKLIIGNHFNQPLQSCNGPFKGWIDDIAIWQRELTNTEVSQYLNGGAANKFSYVWSNGSKKSFISINPAQTSTYKLSSLNCISTCTDSITIVVDALTPPTLPDNLNACGDSVLLNPASNGKYVWNTGDTTASIYAKATGLYKVNITNGVCTATDSVNVSLLKAKITASKLRICKGETVTLSANNNTLYLKQCDKSGLAPNLQNGLVGYWPFCGNANDASGNGNNGTVNGATLTTDRFGKTNSAYYFPGNITNKIVIPNSNSFNFNNGFTVSAWAYFQQSWNYHAESIIYKGASPFNSGWHIGVDQNSGAYGNGNYRIGVDLLGKSSANYCCFPFQNINNWRSCILVYDGNFLKIYVDGILQASTSSSNATVNNSLNIEIGGSVNPVSGAYNRSIDDIGIWNRALSASEIQQLYSGSASQSQTNNWTSNTTSGSLGTDTVLTVTPTTTTKYYVTVNNGISSCLDSVTIVVDTITPPTLPDNLNACGDSVLLNPASNGTFTWNTGATTASIYAKATGLYKVNINNGVCTASDSVNVSLLKAKITASKLRICKGETVTLQADTTVGSLLACAKTDLPSNLQTGLVAYYPFCGNANDASGNGNNGTVNGATLTTDRFGKANSAYNFNGYSYSGPITSTNYIVVPNLNLPTGNYTITGWFKNQSYDQPGRRILSHYSYSPANEGMFAVATVNYSQHSPPADSVIQAISNNSKNGSIFSSDKIQLNKYYFFAITYSADTVSMIINDHVSYKSSGNGIGLTGDNKNLYIGSGSIWTFNGDIDDIGIWNRALSASEIQQLYNAGKPTYSWNTGATTNAITVAPTTTTTYTLTVGNGISTCTDQVTVEVDALTPPTLPDNLNACGDSVLLKTGSNGTYVWNTGAITDTIYAKATGLYKVNITNGVCTAADSVNVSLLKAKITASKLRICKGETVTLQADTTIGSLLACAKTDLPSNLQTGLVAYYPFCGNANDASGNGNNGTVNGATLTTDRYGRANSAYSFTGSTSSPSYISGDCSSFPTGNKTVSLWFYGNDIGAGTAGRGLFAYGGNTCGQTWLQALDNLHNGGNTYEVQGHCDNQLVSYNYGSLHPNGQWIHWLITTDNINGTKFYLNGVNVTTNPTYINQTYVFGKKFMIGSNVSTNGLNFYWDANVFPFNGNLDDIGIWNRALTASEVQQLYNAGKPTYTWNTGATSNAISVTPTTTTTYTLTVGNGISSCTDQVTVEIDALTPPTLPDNLNVCGDSVLLNPGSNGKYVWNTGDTTASIYAKATGLYKVNITKGVCTATDSVYVSLLKAKITASKLRICKGDTVKLSANNNTLYLKQCDKSGLAPNLQNGLVGYWPFCGNANDVSGNGNNGTVNGATLTTDRYGRPSSAYSFDGVSNNINLNNSKLIDSLNDFSILIWVNANNLSNQFQHLVSKDTMGLPPKGDWDLYLNYNKVKFEFNLNSNNYSLTTNSSIIPNKWNCIFIKRNSLNGLLELYLNGTFESSINAFTGPVFNKQKLSIGNQGSSSQHFFNGKLDDIGIWNRALSASEIQQLYASGQTYNWSSNNTAGSLGTDTVLTVTPTTTTTYTLTVGNGISSCTDQVTVEVDALTPPTLPDNLNVCGDSVLLKTGSNGTYVWNTGAITDSIYAKATGLYKVNITNGVCTASDSVYVSLLKAKITASKLRICKGETVTLSANNNTLYLKQCDKSGLAPNLQNGLVGYWPFCGNANDASGNGNNGTVNGATLTTDRFGRPSSAYSFSKNSNNSIDIQNFLSNNFNNKISVSLWANIKSNWTFGAEFLLHYNLNSSNGFLIGIDQNNSIYGNGNYMTYSELISFPPGQSKYIIGDFTKINKWINYTFTFDGSLMKFYVNGILKDSSFHNYTILKNQILQFGGQILGYSHSDKDLDDIGIWNRALSASEIQQLYSGSASQSQTNNWTSNTTSGSLSTDTVLTVTPTTTTTYTLTVGNGISTCTDQVTVEVDALTPPTLPDNLNACGDSVLLNPASNGKYVWNTGDTTTRIYAKATGLYKVNINNGVCTATDSVNVSLLKAKITASKLRICKGETVTLQADTTVGSLLACAKTDLPSNLQTGLVAYYPFCGNANDASGNGNNGTVNGATLTTDRFGKANSAYSFDGVSNTIQIPVTNLINGKTFLTISTWVKAKSGSIFGNWYYNPSSGSVGLMFGLTPQGYFVGAIQHGLDIIGTNLNSVDSWHLLVVTYDGTISIPQQRIKAYIDGQIQNLTFGYNHQPASSIGTQAIDTYLGARQQNPPNLLTTNDYNGKIDEVGIWNRALSASEIQQLYNAGKPTYSWNTGATSNAISVTPPTTTTYTLTLGNGISTCTDQVTVVVDELPIPNLSDTLKICGDSVVLNPGNFDKYEWSNGEKTNTLTAKASGLYSVMVTNTLGCTATDNVYVSLLKAKITASKLRICKGDTVKLRANNNALYSNQCDKSGLALNLQNGLVGYWPFCGNANDESGNGNNGTVNGATLTTDRFGRPSRAYQFTDNINSKIVVAHNTSLNFNTKFSVSYWMKIDNPWSFGVVNTLFKTQDPFNNGFSTGINRDDNYYGAGVFNIGFEVRPFYVNSYPKKRIDFSFLNQWHLVSTTYDSDSLKLYIDGKLLDAVPYKQVVLNNTAPLIIGGVENPQSPRSEYRKLDEIGIWNRALSASEIQQLYSGSASQSQTNNWTSNTTSGSLGTDTVLTVNPTTTTTYILTVGNGISTCTDQVTVVVDELPIPNLSDTLKICGDSVVLNPGSFDKYEWSNGEKTNTLTAKASGLYSVMVTNTLGCTATDSVYVHFTNTNFLLSDTLVCSGAGFVSALPQEKGGVFSGTHVVNNQFQIPATGGLYNISYTINNGTCSKTTTQYIRVVQRKDPNFLASTVKLCRADGPVLFTMNEPNGLFYKDNTPFNSKQFVADKVGKFVFKYVVQAEQCFDSASQTIEVIERPNAQFNPTQLRACVGDPPIQLNPVVSGGTFTGSNLNQTTFVPSKAGSFPVVYTISNEKCTDTSSQTIVVYDKPQGSIAYTPFPALINDVVVFTYNGTPVTNYLWNFGTTADPSSSTLAKPSTQFVAVGLSKVYLTVTNAEGCVNNIEYTINIKDNSSLFVPNAFTPGVDGVNDLFYLVGEGIARLNFTVYNRWGEMIFEATDISKGWDGKYQGQPCPAGVYYYILDAAGTDKKVYQMNGTITLIR